MSISQLWKFTFRKWNSYTSMYEAPRLLTWSQSTHILYSVQSFLFFLKGKLTFELAPRIILSRTKTGGVGSSFKNCFTPCFLLFKVKDWVRFSPADVSQRCWLYSTNTPSIPDRLLAWQKRWLKRLSIYTISDPSYGRRLTQKRHSFCWSGAPPEGHQTVEHIDSSLSEIVCSVFLLFWTRSTRTLQFHIPSFLRASHRAHNAWEASLG